MTTNKIWVNLQKNNYFKKHKLYNKFQPLQPSFVEIEDVRDKVILDIGCGYGRMLAWFSLYTKKSYGIDVSRKILNEAKQFIIKNGKIENIKLLLTNEYQKLNVSLDYIFCRYVFQHITKEQCKDYLTFINKNLKIGGKINFQFRLGNKIKIEEGKEPIIEYTLEEIVKLLSNFEINKFITKDKQIYFIGTKTV